MQDIAELEESVGSNLWPIEQLGPPQRVLRAFRRLLFLETTALADSPLLAELPSSIVLHHLYCRAPTALQSPHTRSGFTPQQVRLRLVGGMKHDDLQECKSEMVAIPDRGMSFCSLGVTMHAHNLPYQGCSN